MTDEEEGSYKPGPVVIEAKDFRVLERVRWTPDGVGLLVGSNGAGKTTLLQAIMFLRDTFLRGISQAVRLQRGLAGLRRLGAPGPGEITMKLSVRNLGWELNFSVEAGSVGEYPGEIFWRSSSTTSSWRTTARLM